METARNDELFRAHMYGTHACTAQGTGLLSGSLWPPDEPGLLEFKDALGQTLHVYVCLLRSMVVSKQPPSGSVVMNARPVFYDMLPTAQIDSTGVGFGIIRSMDAPLKGSSLAKNRKPPKRKGGHTANATVAHVNIVREVQEAYGMHTTDLAEVLQVTRQTVHAWKTKGGSPPNRISSSKLMRLHDGVTEWRKAFLSESPGWLLLSSFDGKPLKAWLSSVATGETELSTLLKTVRKSLDVGITGPDGAKPVAGYRTALQKFVDELSPPDMNVKKDRS